MRVGLILQGGFHRSGRRHVIPALLALVGRLARRHEMHVFALGQHPEPCTYPLVGATVHDLAALPAPRGMGMIRAVPRLLRALRAAGPFDVLHGYMGVPSGAVAVAAGRALRVPVVISFAGNELVSIPAIGYGLGRTRRGRLLRRLIAGAAARLTVPSAYMAALAHDQGFQAELVPWGIDLALAPPGERPDEGPPWRLLHVASLNTVKDQHTLFLALKEVLAAEPRVHLDLVGADALAGRVHAECERQGLGPHVTFHGELAADEVWPFYRQAHLLVQSSRHEAAAVVVQEAAACGLPAVGTAVGTVADWAPQGAARAVPVGDAGALARAILELLADGEARRRLGEAAWTLCQARDADWTARRLEAIYTEAAARGPR
jgi:glycosyltransferase involved in cell wall biosynthesis